MTRTEACLALNLLPGIGPVRVRRLVDAFGSPEAILRIAPPELQRVEGIGPELARIISTWESRIDLSRELRRITEIGAHIITPHDETWPEPLRHVYDAPLLLYVHGKIEARDRHAIAIVGSRRASHYGIQSARKISFQLAHSGITVLSGLALGIDAAAHEGALAAKGRTIGVIGSGLGKFYPSENAVLAQRIAAGSGAVVSEFPVDANPDRQSFPLRNRIVAGWSQGVLCVEAPGRSGSLITCQQATDYGRPVYAVPGNIDRPGSLGCNRLIQEGAKLVVDGNDILSDLEWLIPPAQQQELALAPQKPATVLSAEETKLYQALSTDEVNFDDLVTRTGLPASTVTVTLMKLEIKKMAKQLPGRFFVRLLG
jgi:DNA processing protein